MRTAVFAPPESPVIALFRGKSQKKRDADLSKEVGVSSCSGGGIRTRDLRVMSPMSYLLLHPAM